MRPVTLLISIPFFFLGNKVANKSVQSPARCDVLHKKLALKHLYSCLRKNRELLRWKKKSASTASAQVIFVPGVVFEVHEPEVRKNFKHT